MFTVNSSYTNALIICNNFITIYTLVESMTRIVSHHFFDRWSTAKIIFDHINL